MSGPSEHRIAAVHISAVSEQKASLRAAVRERRRARASQPRGEEGTAAGFSHAIHAALSIWERSAPVEQVLMFLPLPTEPPVLAAAAELRAQGREILMPRVAGRRLLEWVSWDPGCPLRPSSIPGLMEPEGRVILPVPEAGLFLPALALGPDGTRLGQGGGFYDTFLAHPHAPTRRAGVVFSEELLDVAVPADPWDARLSLAATEKGVWALEEHPPAAPGNPGGESGCPQQQGWRAIA